MSFKDMFLFEALAAILLGRAKPFLNPSSEDGVYIWSRLKQSFCINTVDCLLVNLKIAYY